MTLQVVEGEVAWFSELSIADIPQPLPKGIALHIRRDGALGLEVEGLTGALPLLNGETLQILPKIGRVNFLRLLFRAEGLQEDLSREYDNFVSYSLEDERNTDAVVARSIFEAAEEIMRRSPLFGRVWRRQEGPFAAGRLAVTQTALAMAEHRIDPVVFDTRQRTFDIPENRIISEALARAWPHLHSDHRQRLRYVLDRWSAKFPRSRNVSSDLETVENRFAAHRYGGPRDYYRKALMLAQVLLGSMGLGLADSAQVVGDAILLNTSDVFEKYLRKTLTHAHSSSGYLVTKGGSHTASLYVDGSFGLQPDIVIERNGQVTLVADAKYKEPTGPDHYQMYVYMSRFNVSSGMLLTAGSSTSTKVVIDEFRTPDRRIVRTVRLPLGELAVTEAFLGTVTALS